jgi:phage terminase large subunit GpA-like protein
LSEIWGETEPGVEGYIQIRARNEALDTFIYAKAAALIAEIHTFDETLWDVFEAEMAD